MKRNSHNLGPLLGWKIFGRTPVRAMQDAAKSVSRALKKNAFPLELQRFDLDWDVVFMDLPRAPGVSWSPAMRRHWHWAFATCGEWIESLWVRSEETEW